MAVPRPDVIRETNTDQVVPRDTGNFKKHVDLRLQINKKIPDCNFYAVRLTGIPRNKPRKIKLANLPEDRKYTSTTNSPRLCLSSWLHEKAHPLAMQVSPQSVDSFGSQLFFHSPQVIRIGISKPSKKKNCFYFSEHHYDLAVTYLSLKKKKALSSFLTRSPCSDV